MSTRVAGAFLVILLCPHAQAQAPKGSSASEFSQEAFIFEHWNESVRFENDGSGIRETNAVIRIQSQAGVQEFGQLVFGYSTANEDLTIDYVRVRSSDGQVISTPVNSAQDFAPEVFREAPMYSDYRERHVPVSELRPGVELEYHTTTRVRPLATGEFWYEHSFPSIYALYDATLEISVPRNREIKLKSPDRKFETRDEGDRRIYSWSIKNFVPDRSRQQEEEPADEDTPDVQLSTFTDWQQIAVWYAKLQSDRAVPNQSIKAKANELTRGAPTPEEKARRLYDFVAQNIRYVSLSFGIGRFQPHDAADVLQNGYGDCKDKHTLLQSMLAAEGIRSYPVLIHAFRKLDPDVPSPAQFDHLITAASIGGNLVWLDSTAEVAPYGLISYSLRNKQAVVASTDSAGGLKRTPAESPVKNVTTLTVKAKVSELGALDADLELTATGDSDWPLRGVFRRFPRADWPRTLEMFSRAWGLGAGEVSNIDIPDLENTGRPLRITYHLRKADYFKVPNPAVNFQMLPPSSIGRVPKASKKHPNEPLDVGPAGENVYRAHIEFPSNFSIHVPADVSVTREYGVYSTTYKLEKNILDEERRKVLKVNELPALRRADYSSFHNVTTSAVEETPWCSIAQPSAESLAAAAHMQGTTAQLREAGGAALNRQDFATAAALLQRAADQDPASTDVWEQLGKAYSGLNEHEKALKAFQKEIENKPGSARANGEVATELAQLRRFDDAIAAYRKQIEVAPSEKLGHKQLGLLLVQLKRDSEARQELETAASMPPDDPEVKMALAQLYSRTGENKKSELLMASLTGGTGGSIENDFFAAALRDDVDPAQAAHDAEKNLSDIGNQFDSGEYDHLDTGSYSAMDLVALSWARMGWARFLQGDSLVASQFLESAWDLSHSGTIANRLARVYEKTGARDRAQRMYALAVAAGGPLVQDSRERLLKLNPPSADRVLAEGATDLQKLHSIPLPRITSQTASARVVLLFDNSSTADRVQFVEGSDSLRGSGDALEKLDFPLKFPDVSSIKIILLGTVSCNATGCRFDIEPLKSMQNGPSSEMVAGASANPAQK